MDTKVRRTPEVLAPAGDKECLQAALAAGADAVYFGLSSGFNARSRAQNFSPEELPELISSIHSCGAKAHITLNTLVFENELEAVAKLIRQIASAQADAIIVQDLGVVCLAHSIAPKLAIHASTQMTVSSILSADFAGTLGLKRLVLPRECSVAEVAQIAEHTDLETEVFVLGAECVSFSGQCLASLTWGGRSANRGECAQACRFNYQAYVDGQPLREVPSPLLSARDLAGFFAIEGLCKAGVTSFKIEGRMKSPAYVYTATKAMREWLDAIERGVTPADRQQLNRNFTDLGVAYSRGFGPGSLAGINNRFFINDENIKHQGVWLGTVESVRSSSGLLNSPNDCVVVSTAIPAESEARAPLPALEFPSFSPITPTRGMGVLFCSSVSGLKPNAKGHSQNGEEERTRVGGPIFDVRFISSRLKPPAVNARYARLRKEYLEALANSNAEQGSTKEERRNQNRFDCICRYELAFGHPGPDLSLVQPGDDVYITSTPQLHTLVKENLKAPLKGRMVVDFKVKASLGNPLRIEAFAGGKRGVVTSQSVLSLANSRALTTELLREKLSELGGTPFTMGSIDDSKLEAGLFLPLSELKPLRRTLIDHLFYELHRERQSMKPTGLKATASKSGQRPLGDVKKLVKSVAPWKEQKEPSALRVSRVVEGKGLPRCEKPSTEPHLAVLCRSREQVHAALDCACLDLELDFANYHRLSQVVEELRQLQEQKLPLLRYSICTARIQKTGEESLDAKLVQLKPNAVLIRNLGSLEYFLSLPSQSCPQLYGDFSLNVTNSLSAACLLDLGISNITVGDDVSLAAIVNLVSGNGVSVNRCAGVSELASRLTVSLYRHVPAFHTQHCFYAQLISHAKNNRTCHQACQEHQLHMQDRFGHMHPVLTDCFCRNTVYDIAPRTSTEDRTAILLELGISRFRVELLDHDGEDACSIINHFKAGLKG